MLIFWKGLFHRIQKRPYGLLNQWVTKDLTNGAPIPEYAADPDLVRFIIATPGRGFWLRFFIF